MLPSKCFHSESKKPSLLFPLFTVSANMLSFSQALNPTSTIAALIPAAAFPVRIKILTSVCTAKRHGSAQTQSHEKSSFTFPSSPDFLLMQRTFVSLSKCDIALSTSLCRTTMSKTYLMLCSIIGSVAVLFILGGSYSINAFQMHVMLR